MTDQLRQNKLGMWNVDSQPVAVMCVYGEEVITPPLGFK